MPLPYYARLNRRDKKIYRQSDALKKVPLPDAEALSGWCVTVREGLVANHRNTVQKATHRLVRDVLRQLDAPPVTVRILTRRPHDDESELHGLYECFDDDTRPVLRAWMRTAVHQRPVAFKSFLRTVLHEVCHHLDYTVFGLADSFHTEGFFQREAHLARQLFATAAIVDGTKPQAESPDDAPAAKKQKRRVPRPRTIQKAVRPTPSEQLTLHFE